MTIAERIYKHYEDNQEPQREHLGPSQIGRPCDREIWLNFRHAMKPKFDGRMLKLFKRGHREEPFIIGDLQAIGINVTNRQRKLEIASHFKGSIDGEADGMLLECKTAKLKNFGKVPHEHIAQVQVYMHAGGYSKCLYIQVCKDDDRIYDEIIEYNRDIALKYIERGIRIINAARLPEPMVGASPTWYECKWCAYYGFCWKREPITERNCRTCAHSTPGAAHTWTCEKGRDAFCEEYEDFINE